jgi:DTW domain-containing protein YfiP
VCICESLPDGAPFDTKTEVIIFVHPKELKRKCGTLPLLQAGLRGIRIVEGESFPEPEECPGLHTELGHVSGLRRAALVCPGPGAMSPEEFRDAAIGDDGKPLPLSLILVDGTWIQAKSMIRKSKWLLEIPRVVLKSTSESGYRFRQQPKDGCLSTLEAVGEALAVLEGRHGQRIQEGLKNMFSAMVEKQLSFIPEEESVDKNAPGGREAHRKAVVVTTARKVTDRDALPLLGICRWGEWLDLGLRRRMYVEQILRGTTMPEAAEVCQELSNSRMRGRKLFVVKLEKHLPPDAVFECSERP